MVTTLLLDTLRDADLEQVRNSQHVHGQSETSGLFLSCSHCNITLVLPEVRCALFVLDLWNRDLLTLSISFSTHGITQLESLAQVNKCGCNGVHIWLVYGLGMPLVSNMYFSIVIYARL